MSWCPASHSSQLVWGCLLTNQLIILQDLQSNILNSSTVERMIVSTYGRYTQIQADSLTINIIVWQLPGWQSGWVESAGGGVRWVPPPLHHSQVSQCLLGQEDIIYVYLFCSEMELEVFNQIISARHGPVIGLAPTCFILFYIGNIWYSLCFLVILTK